MKITDQQVRYVAGLANLTLSEDEVARFTQELGSILDYMDQLRGIDVEGIPPMTQVLYESGERGSLRPDVERAPLGNSLAVANAPTAGMGYFKVPRVIER